MKYFYSILALLFFVLGMFVYGSTSEYHFIYGAASWATSSLCFGLALRADAIEN